MIKILIVDDEKPICDLIDINLSAAGYQCKSVQDGLAAIDLIERESFDLILLDIMLPGADGFDIMEYIRPLKVPVIFITARGEVKNKIKGLKLGAEDYLVKPFDVLELAARVEVVLRRFHKTEQTLTAGDVTVDLEARKVTRGGRPVVLTNKYRSTAFWYFLSAIKMWLFSRKLSMRRSGETSTWRTAGHWSSMSRDFGGRWAGKRIWWRFIKWDIGWRSDSSILPVPKWINGYIFLRLEIDLG